MIRRLALVLAGTFLAMGLYWFYAQNRPKQSPAANERAGAGGARLPPSPDLPQSHSSAKVVPTRPHAALAGRKRSWDASSFFSLRNANPGDVVRFELVGDQFAVGSIQRVQRAQNELVYVSGTLTQPEAGQFFFQKQTMPGVAGAYVGVVTFPQSEKAYRLEPTGPGGTPELVERPLGQVLCRHWPKAAALPANRTADIPPLNPGNYPTLPIPGYQNGVVILESLRGAGAVVYLDFQGGYTPSWGGVNYERPQVSNDQIREVWMRVAEDFMPFKINVTTDLAVYQNAPANSRQHVIITPTTTVAGEAGGVAYIGSFNWTGDTPCWVFILSGKGCAEACAHEVGHTLGLQHEGQETGGQPSEYYFGQGDGQTSWAPIMGVPYYATVTQWSKGEYLNPDNLQDELAIITTQNNNVGYRADDTGDTLAGSRYLEVYEDMSAFAEGVIERSADTDAFQFTTGGGAVWLRADPVSAGPDLAVAVSLYDAQDRLLASSEPQDTLWASLSTNLAAGTYTFRVSGAGRNDPLTNGFSSYASLGYYSITGSVANARLPTRLSVPEHSTNGTVVGIIAAGQTSEDTLKYQIISGNTGGTFALDEAGTLTVANNTLLDYEALASQTQLAVGFELFVSIQDLSNPWLSETNRRVVVAVTYTPTPPLIQEQPQDLTVPAGTNVLLTVAAMGQVPLAYQWFFNGTALAQATNSALRLLDVQSAQNGGYSALITNSLGWATSQVAHLSVLPSPPFVLQQPQSLAACYNFPAALDLVAGGTEPLTYQWQLDQTNIAWGNGNQLSVGNLTPQVTGWYRVIVSNALGVAVSAPALLATVPVAAWGGNEHGQTRLPVELTNAVAMAAGADYNLALRADGTVMAWGSMSASAIPSDLTNVVAVAAGGGHALALRATGQVVAWGADSDGQADVPDSLSNVVAIAAGDAHSLALQADGTVVSWGLNSSGQATVPGGLTNVIAIAAGNNHSLALGSDGQVMAWGDDSFGQADIPTNVTDAVAIAAGGWHSLALRSNGSVVAWGNNSLGQCLIPSGLANVTAVAAGSLHSVALTRSGNVLAWGAGLTPNLVYPQLAQSIVPAQLKNANVTAISAGTVHSLAFDGLTAPFIFQQPVGVRAFTGRRVVLRAAATGARPLFYQWQLNGTNVAGATDQVLIIPYALTNASGQYRLVVRNVLGTNISAPAVLALQQAAPILALQPADQSALLGGPARLQVVAYGSEPLFYQWRLNGLDLPGATNPALTFSRLQQNQAGYYSVLVSNALGQISSLKASLSIAQVLAWGAGTTNIGMPNFGQSLVPAGLNGVTSVAGGTYHSLALQADGRVVAWGAGTNIDSERFYYNNFGQSLVPEFSANIMAIAAGSNQSLALGRNGQVYAWGGLVGNSGPLAQAIVPANVQDVVAIAAGSLMSVALGRNGGITTWAARGFIQTNTPPAAVNVTAIDAKGTQILALRGDGAVVRWGTSTYVPSSVSDVVAIAAGVDHCLALRANGTVVSWDSIYAPPAGLTNVVQIAAGNGFSLALTADGNLLAWGRTIPYGATLTPPRVASNVVAIACGDYHALAVLGDGSPTITLGPFSHAANLGDKTFLRSIAMGDQPIHYQWRFNGATLTNATSALLRFDSARLTDAGSYDVIATNPRGAVTSQVATLSVQIPFASVLGGPGLVWTTLGNAPWTGQTNVTFDGLPTAQSGLIADNQQSSVETAVTGPGTLTFWWKVSSEQFYDLLNFYLDTTWQAAISGDVEWRPVTQRVPAGPHVLRWTYGKDPEVSAGADAGWLAQVNFIPDTPTFLVQPVGQTVFMGATFSLNATVLAQPPLSYQWLKNGVAVPGAVTALFTVSNATRLDSGMFQLAASNPLGTTLSQPATVLVRVPQKLGSARMLSEGGFLFVSADADGGPLGIDNLANLQAQVSTNLLEWAPLAVPLQLTNGALLLIDPGAAGNNRARFYRLLER